jgi:Flp pilus assembly protein TadG
VRRLSGLINRGQDPDIEKGAAGVLLAVLMLVLVGVGAIAVDVGQIYAERAELQNGADAGALAGAQLCSAAGGCAPADATAVAAALAGQNSRDGVSNVRAVNLSVAGEVTVSTSTINGSDGSGFLSRLFSSALNTPAVSVGATATAGWRYPVRGVSILPLAVAGCEFHEDGLPRKLLTHGGEAGAPDCAGRNPADQTVPGGFGWLRPDADGGCKVTAEVGQWSTTSSGASIPAGCGEVFNSSLVGQTVALPVYAYSCKEILAACTDSNAQYMIQKWAGFNVQGWNFPGSSSHDPDNVFHGDEKGLYGTFTGYSADPALFTGGSSTPNGNVIAVGLKK